MLLVTSAYINELLASNNDMDTFRFFDYSNIIIDNDGDYVISNNFFQGTNITDYISLYNDSFGKEQKQELIDNLCTADYSDDLYFDNNKGQYCAYIIVPVQNSDWHLLGVVPLDSFHNAYDYNRNCKLFAMLFGLLSVMDITVILVINRQLRRRTREAQAANAAKSDFLSAMSHDIRTPMNAIIGTTIIAREELQKEDINVEALRENIATISYSGRHLMTLINDILDISKIENGKLMISPDNFSICENVSHMIEMLQGEIHKKNLVMEVHMEGVSHDYVFADALRINQIYMNILSNAIKYTNPGGKIMLSLTEESAQDSDNCARFRYEVKDTGIGMDSQFLKTIFDRFSRAVDTRVNSTQGTGLGMAICKQLVDLLGGTITVESEIDKGSTFVVTLELPILDRASQTAMENRSGAKKPSTDKQQLDMHVLVVEDNQLNWDILNRLLTMYGVQADWAENGKIAVEMVQDRDETYDLVFMDVQMPVMNGYEATRGIRSLSDVAKAAVPIYAMTADTFAEDIAKCKEVGMNGHLSKPVEMDKLVDILQEYGGDRKTQH